ncbi:uncharacterized protein [Spinacia oleracea]|uniref:Retrovirus-related Pol polyprotein from transposon TNT 1-94-like beta-barrel domain-containing protein n=1 Tax=Spinacia oleracea TaxID=3562 RepID=A0ABM3RPT6_SPIOL|nr:uncharacterized protein LOC130471482 [Spinacia oleracea]
MCEILQANVLIEKLPDSWSDYRNLLKHKKRDLTLVELVSHMKVEEVNRLKDTPLKPKNELAVRANLFETNVYSDKNAGHGNLNRGQSSGNTKKGKNKKRNNKAKLKSKAHIAETDDVIVAVNSEVNLVENITEWIVDTGASRHLCANKDMFVELEKVEEGKQVYMENSRISEVLGKGKVILNFTSGKTLALHNVMYVPSLRRNLIFGALLNKVGVKLVFEANKLVHLQ